jgi:hypothetical protein
VNRILGVLGGLLDLALIILLALAPSNAYFRKAQPYDQGYPPPPGYPPQQGYPPQR